MSGESDINVICLFFSLALFLFLGQFDIIYSVCLRINYLQLHNVVRETKGNDNVF
jgi:hypothetical protein